MEPIGVIAELQLSEIKDMLHRCTRCGACRQTRPLYLPICPSGTKFGFETYYASGRSKIALGLTQGKFGWSESLLHPIYTCTTCGACSELCVLDYGEYSVLVTEALRAESVKAGVGPMSSQKKWGKHINEEHNPYMEKHVDRLNWLPNDLKNNLPKKAEYVYFAGCTSSYRQKNVARATVEALSKLGVDFTVLKDEWCCGSPNLRTGQWDAVKDLAQHNIDAAGNAGDKLITTCAGCYRTWKEDYKETYKDLVARDFDIKVVHTIELLADLIKKGELKFKDGFSRKVTYHDPCHLGRHAEVYEAPREVLKAIPEIELVEMERNKENAWCCGGGGGVKSAFPDWATEVAYERIREAEKTGAEVLTSVCPFCFRNFHDAVEKNKSKIELYDIVEIVAKII